tara:strand:+ start:11648 stop:12016 length:369 start_codon:yes stop_codon:yes gene_type:complete
MTASTYIPNLPLDARVELWVLDLCDALEANYERQYPDSHNDKRFEAVGGRKYWKIITKDIGADGKEWSGGVHAFVDKKTGEVYKPASWKAPAKHVRYDLRIINQREECLARADWAGGYLYIR